MEQLELPFPTEEEKERAIYAMALFIADTENFEHDIYEVTTSRGIVVYSITKEMILEFKKTL